MNRGIAAWTLLLWGPLIWFAHFGTVYAAASFELTLRPQAGALSRLAIGALTVLALAAIGGGWAKAPGLSPGAPGSELARFWTSATRLLCVIAAVAVAYQALPALLVP